jgi:hypothetical protein
MIKDQPERTSMRDEEEHLSLCEMLDRILNKGVVISGEAVISVADVDLLYLQLHLLLSSVETARQVSVES